MKNPKTLSEDLKTKSQRPEANLVREALNREEERHEELLATILLACNPAVLHIDDAIRWAKRLISLNRAKN